MTDDAHLVSTAVAGAFPSLLRLPCPGAEFHSGQNFTAATALLNLIAGASVWCFDASEDGLTARGERSRRFRRLVTDYWPWAGEGVDNDTGVNVLYTYARNPLSHTAGLPGPGDDDVLVRIVKAPLTTAQIAELSACERRPNWLGPTIRPAAHSPLGTAYDLAIPGLYWSVQRLLRALLKDPQQASAASDIASVTIRRLNDPNAPWRYAADIEREAPPPDGTGTT